MAYLGFAESLEEDAAGTRHLAATLPEVFIAASCSKNFGLYRERAGVVLIVTGEGAPRDAAAGTLSEFNRQNYTFPPDHGARVVETILNDPEPAGRMARRAAAMRRRCSANRAALAEALRAETGSDRFGYLGANRGMFSLIGATP
jgi:aspartate/tyrosine/aromatic aminotransferase